MSFIDSLQNKVSMSTYLFFTKIQAIYCTTNIYYYFGFIVKTYEKKMLAELKIEKSFSEAMKF